MTQSMAENTYYRSRGKNIVKVKIDTNNSRTLKQQQQRAKMRTLIPLCKALNTPIHAGFPERPTDFSAWNAFVSLNVGHVSVTEDLEVTVSYPDVLCAQGRWIKLPRTMSVSADAEMRSLTFTHAAEENGTMRYGDDMLYAMVVDTDLQDAELYELNARNNSEPVMITLPDDWDMDALAVYVFALTADKKKASNSKYMEIA